MSFRWMLAFTVLCVGFLARAQETRTQDSKEKRLGAPRFVSQKTWAAPRWYVIGRVRPSNGLVEWLGGSQSSYPKGCTSGIKWSRPDSADGPLETLATREWIAAEVSPDVGRLQIKVSGANDCEGTISADIAWRGEKGLATPLLVLKPIPVEFFGQAFLFSAPEKGERADVQLELMLGIWRGSFPNADVAGGAKTSFWLVPTAIARGEWLLPFYRKMGLDLALEQTVSNIGAGEGQAAYYSDWFAGFFYQHIFPALDGIQVRGSFKYHQHLADDNRDVPTLATNGRESQHFILGATTNVYFARRWLAGGEILWGLPSKLAGHGRTTFVDFTGRVGLRVTGYIYLMAEGGLRTYGFSGASSEKLTKTQLGIKLDL